MPNPFEPDEEPTRPETWRAILRQMSERVRACAPGDITVLQMLRESATNSDADMARYLAACHKFVERLLG